MSLAARACSGDVSLDTSTAQSGTYDHISAYLSVSSLAGFENGPVMCAMALIIWILTAMQDTSASITFVHAVWTIPTASDTTLSLDDDKNSEFVGITSMRRSFTIVVQLCRIGIAIALLWGGSLFLAYTISLSDLILNAMVKYSPR